MNHCMRRLNPGSRSTAAGLQSPNDTAHQTGAGSATPVWCGA